MRFSTVAEDPDGDSVAVRFDWGDSTMSDWSALVSNGDSVMMTHAWQTLAAYSVRAQARDVGETASVWSAEHQLVVSSFLAPFGGVETDVGFSVLQTSDGGYIIVGYTDSYGAGFSDVWLVKTDESGGKAWTSTLGGIGGDGGNSVRQTSDGGYVVAGYTVSYGAGDDDIWLVKTDGSGNKVWSRAFGGAGFDMGNQVLQTSDGGYVIVGVTNSYGAGGDDVWLIKTDASGNEVWDKTYGGTAGDRGNSILQSSDGGYIIAGATHSSGAGFDDVWLLKVDELGNKVWDRAFGGTGSEGGSAVWQTTDGGSSLRVPPAPMEQATLTFGSSEPMHQATRSGRGPLAGQAKTRATRFSRHPTAATSSRVRLGPTVRAVKTSG